MTILSKLFRRTPPVKEKPDPRKVQGFHLTLTSPIRLPESAKQSHCAELRAYIESLKVIDIAEALPDWTDPLERPVAYLRIGSEVVYHGGENGDYANGVAIDVRYTGEHLAVPEIRSSIRNIYGYCRERGMQRWTCRGA